MSDNLPVFIQALSGNTSDKNHFREIVKEYGRSLQEKWGENADTKKMKSTSLDGYHLFSTEVEYGGVKQRWVVVFSVKAFGRETKTLEKKIKKENREGNVEKRKFIVATNELDSEKLSDEEVLKAYKCGAEPHINSHHLLQTHIQHLLRLSCKRLR